MSCAGNGMIHFTDLNRESTYGQFPFDCHAGTTYEVNCVHWNPLHAAMLLESNFHLVFETLLLEISAGMLQSMMTSRDRC